MKLTLQQLSNLDDALYIFHTCYKIEKRTEPKDKLQAFLKADNTSMNIAFFFYFMSKLLNKHPQKLCDFNKL